MQSDLAISAMIELPKYDFRMKNSEIIHLIRAVFLAAVIGGNRKHDNDYFLSFSSEVIIMISHFY